MLQWFYSIWPGNSEGKWMLVLEIFILFFSFLFFGLPSSLATSNFHLWAGFANSAPPPRSNCTVWTACLVQWRWRNGAALAKVFSPSLSLFGWGRSRNFHFPKTGGKKTKKERRGKIKRVRPISGQSRIICKILQLKKCMEMRMDIAKGKNKTLSFLYLFKIKVHFRLRRN